jgi:hypothetical protein
MPAKKKTKPKAETIAPKTKPGPAPLYDPNVHPVIIRNAARAGLTPDQIAAEVSVSRSLLFSWVKKYPEVAESIKEGREYANGKVVDSLFKRAIGYEFIETEAKTETKGTGEHKSVTETVRKARKHFPGDVKAQIFWLSNRAAAMWRNRQTNELTGPDGGAIKTETKSDLSGLTPEKLRALEIILSSGGSGTAPVTKP